MIEEQVFETRFHKSKATFKIGIEKLKVITPEDDIKDPRDNMMLLTGEEIKIEHGQCFRKTRDGANGKTGDWRRCRADGNFFRKTAPQRPADMIQSIWHTAKRFKELQQQIALLEMEKIIENKANSELLAEAKKPEVLAEITKERKAQKKREVTAKKGKGLKIKDRREPFESRLKKVASIVGRVPDDTVPKVVEKEASQGSDSESSEKTHGTENKNDAGFGYELPGGLARFYNLIAAAAAAAAQTGERLTSEQLRATVAKTLGPETKKAENTAELVYPLTATGELEDFGASISFDQKTGIRGVVF